MIKKYSLTGVLLLLCQMQTPTPSWAMEKPTIKTEQKKDKEETLSETEKKRLTENRMILHVAMKQHFGADVANHESVDVRNVISAKEYDLAQKIIKFKCPTTQELKKTELTETDQRHFINDQGLKFLTTRPLSDVINRVGDLEEVSHTQGSTQVWCSYKNLRSAVFLEVPDEYDLSYDKEKFEISMEDEDGRELMSRKNNVEFTLTKK
jgi:hypothetical protein